MYICRYIFHAFGVKIFHMFLEEEEEGDVFKEIVGKQSLWYVHYRNHVTIFIVTDFSKKNKEKSWQKVSI